MITSNAAIQNCVETGAVARSHGVGNVTVAMAPGAREDEASSLCRSYFFFFLFGRCVKAEPAAVFAALLVDLLRRTFDAAVAARLLVTSRFLLDTRFVIVVPQTSCEVTD